MGGIHLPPRTRAADGQQQLLCDGKSRGLTASGGDQAPGWPGPALKAAWGCAGPPLALLPPPKASRPRQGAQDLPSTAEGPVEVLLYFQ